MSWEFATVFWRDMIRFGRFRTLLFSSLLQPAIWMAFFGIAMSSNFNRFGSFAPAPDGVTAIGYLTFMAAGVIAMTSMFTSLSGGMSLLFDKTFGLMREMLASPMPRSHLLAGIGLSGVVKACIQSVIIMVFGLAIGVGFFPGKTLVGIAVSVAGILIFVGVFSLGFLFLSSAIALKQESHEGMQGIITMLSMPLFFTSNALYPVDNFPLVLKAIAVVNPLTYLVTGIRSFAIGNEFYAFGREYCYTQADILFAFGALCLFTLVTFALAWHSVKRVSLT
ncbi:multidrug ABC transporter permease [Methanoculleus taiwanensis]|uniref:Multidrug ABC transporter permease n=1 Tax=Methanoculleus taiwanensis TaxID=1550565 RepID=A0A498H1M9_9EURY|nr:ABC transporter permease [Methanoculleus taiwanensis]RXE56583.1 multidrug ABC transporter permease [Methanoculleus taiwanensis]